jgi:hypothetical protein
MINNENDLSLIFKYVKKNQREDRTSGFGYVITHGKNKGKKCKILKMDGASVRFKMCKVQLSTEEILDVRYLHLIFIKEMLKEEEELLEKLAQISKIKEAMT